MSDDSSWKGAEFFFDPRTEGACSDIGKNQALADISQLGADISELGGVIALESPDDFFSGPLGERATQVAARIIKRERRTNRRAVATGVLLGVCLALWGGFSLLDFVAKPSKACYEAAKFNAGIELNMAGTDLVKATSTKITECSYVDLNGVRSWVCGFEMNGIKQSVPLPVADFSCE